MTPEDIIPWIQSIFLGKSKPGLDANPFVMAAWLSVPWLGQLAHVYAKRGKDGAAFVFGLSAAALVALMLFNAVPPSKAPEAKKTAPGVAKPSAPTPAHAGSVGGTPNTRPVVPTSTPPPRAAEFDRFNDTTLSGRSFAPPRGMPLTECIEVCGPAISCVGFVYDNGICDMKAELGSRASFDGPIAMIKRR